MAITEAITGIVRRGSPPARDAEHAARADEREADDAAGDEEDGRWWSTERIVIGCLAAFAVAVVFGNQWGQFNPDTTPILYLNPRAALDEALSSWRPSPYQAGYANFNTGLAPVALVIWMLETLGLPPWAAIRFWRASLILIGAWGAMRLYQRLEGPRANAMGRIVTAIVFVANPFLMIGGGSTPLLLPYALLPWMVLAFIHALDEPRGWRWPAGFALIFFAMGGLQAGIVPLLLVLSVPVYLAYSVIFERTRFRDALLVLVKCMVPSIAVSLYWIVPSALAAGAGAAVVAESEDPKLVALTSSFGEGIRMLGLWPMYGRLGGRLFVPKGLAYIVNPFVVFSSYLLPSLAALGAWLSRSRQRAFAIMLLLCSLPVFVGQYPGTTSSPFGMLIDKVLTTVPGAIAFRTTVKMAPLIVLSFVLLIGFGAGALARRGFSARNRWHVLGGVVAVALLFGGIHPAVTNQLYNEGWEIPGYWRAAVADVDARAFDTRVMIAPGSPAGNYRWGPRSADDIFSAVFERPSVSRLTSTSGSIFPANFLSAMDVPLNENAVRPNSLTGTETSITSVMARYFGVGEIVERNDMRWEEFQGGRPSVYDSELASDPGLTRGQSYGAPGTNTYNVDTAERDTRAPADMAIEPIRTFDVVDPMPITRAEPATGAVVIDGDNFALPSLLQLGYLEGSPSFRIAASMTTDDLRTAIADQSRLVLTDTNRRRIWGVHRTDSGFTPTLGVDDPLVKATTTSMTLFPLRPETQTVSQLVGAKSIAATSKGRSGVSPHGGAAAAFDDDLNTGWVSGELGAGLNERLMIVFDKPEEIGKVVIRPLRQKPLQVGAVRLSSDHQSVAQVIPEEVAAGVDDATTFELDGAPTPQITAEIVTLSGQGTNPVGLAEIEVYGKDGTRRDIRTVMRMPNQLVGISKGLSADEQAAMAKLPIDVVMTRVVGQSPTGFDDEESRMQREFELPQDRTFWLRGRFSANRRPSNDALTTYSSGDPICTRIGTIDDQPLMVKINGTVDQIADGLPLELSNCGSATYALAAGTHHVETDPGWNIDLLDFNSVEVQSPPEPGPAPKVTVTYDGSTAKDLAVAAATGPYYLVSGIGFDPRWSGTIDGRPLGPAILVDGFSVGWRIDDPGPHTIKLTFKPQATMNIAIVVSGLGLAVLVAIPLVSWWRRRRYV